MNSIFIRSENLGSIVEGRLIELIPANTKRARRGGFNQIVRLLRLLKLLPAEHQVVALGLAVNLDGETGLLVSFETEKIEGSLP